MLDHDSSSECRGSRYNHFAVPEQPPDQPERKEEDEPMLYCPVCSTRLAEQKCKLICKNCGYYLSCADYY